MMQKLRTSLWFEKGGAEAAEFYKTLLPDSRIENSLSPSDTAPLIVDFSLAGVPYQILNGGPHFKLNEAASISLMAEDQPEMDRLWNALIANGVEDRQSGWLTDRWGLSWQIYPQVLLEMQAADDQVAAERPRQAMYSMKKRDIAALQSAFAEPVP